MRVGFWSSHFKTSLNVASWFLWNDVWTFQSLFSLLTRSRFFDWSSSFEKCLRYKVNISCVAMIWRENVRMRRLKLHIYRCRRILVTWTRVLTYAPKCLNMLHTNIKYVNLIIEMQRVLKVSENIILVMCEGQKLAGAKYFTDLNKGRGFFIENIEKVR